MLKKTNSHSGYLVFGILYRYLLILNTIVMNKWLQRLFSICVFPVLFLNCSSDDVSEEPVQAVHDLRLSVDNNLLSVYSTDTVFQILEGNGEYIAQVSDEKIAKVAVDDTTVYVSFISNGWVDITVTDVKGKTASTSMNVYNESLVPTNSIVILMKDSTYVFDFLSFGAGGYKFENIEGDCVELSLKDDKIVAKALSYGKIYFDIVDKRGSRSESEVWVVAFYELTADRLDINMISDQRTSIKTLYGKNWAVESFNKDLCDVTIIPVGPTNPTDIIQIDTYADRIGYCTILLKDDEGNKATVTVSVTEHF